MATRSLQIAVFFFREGENIISYSPALELASCGRTIKEAQSMFEKALDAFFEELEDMGTTEKALEELGWRRVSTASAQPWRSPSVKVPTHLLSRKQMRVPLPA
jgi:hypothetical protein